MATQSPRKETNKEYVDVILEQTRDGRILPLSLTFQSMRYPIDSVNNVRRTGSLRHKGAWCYSITVLGHESKLFETGGRWYVEAKAKAGRGA